jgi:hypothetical protein
MVAMFMQLYATLQTAASVELYIVWKFIASHCLQCHDISVLYNGIVSYAPLLPIVI